LTIWVNGGQREFLAELAPDAVERALDATLVDVARPT
jgi:prolyl-tRNA editing enzyme YbaK/EbsC (Cys-tRNA(Pro) deacylase)